MTGHRDFPPEIFSTLYLRKFHLLKRYVSAQDGLSCRQTVPVFQSWCPERIMLHPGPVFCGQVNIKHPWPGIADNGATGQAEASFIRAVPGPQRHSVPGFP
jgi:hypothetical protein